MLLNSSEFDVYTEAMLALRGCLLINYHVLGDIGLLIAIDKAVV